MNTEQELLRLQQILGIGVVCIALSLGLGGFDDFSIWHEWTVDEDTIDDYGGSSDTVTLEFTIKQIEWSYKGTDSDGYSDSSSIDIDYGEYDLFEELEKSMPNIEKGGYLVIALIGFILWKLQQMKTETNEEIRKIAFTQMINALKGAGVLVVVVLLYYHQGSAFEDDFDDFFLSEDNGVAICADAWQNEPEYTWSGDSKYSYDNTQCESGYSYGTGKIEFTPKIGFFLFAGSLISILLAFNLFNSNPQLVSFSKPNVPTIQSQITNEQPALKIKNPFAPKKVIKKQNKKATYSNPEASVMALPEDNED